MDVMDKKIQLESWVYLCALSLVHYFIQPVFISLLNTKTGTKYKDSFNKVLYAGSGNFDCLKIDYFASKIDDMICHMKSYLLCMKGSI